MSYRARFYAGLFVDALRAWLAVPLECGRRGEADAARPSPPSAVPFTVGGQEALLCYNRPSARGRRVFGDLVQYGELWRLGANEPTVLHLPFTATIAGIPVRRGKVALYAVPEPDAWTLVINRSTRQWGSTLPERGRDGRTYPSAYTPPVERAEVGRARVGIVTTAYVEQLTAHAQIVGPRCTHLVFEWETTRATIPVEV